MSDISLEKLLEAGAHFGHRTDRWHPRAKKYIFTTRQGVHIIDLEKTAAALAVAEKYMEEQVASGALVLFVCTKRQGRAIVQEAAEAVGMPYVVERWIGGTLTNFKSVYNLPQKLEKLKADLESGALENYTKKERLQVQREIDRLKKLVGGLVKLVRTPSIIFLVDVKKDTSAVKEARAMGIPMVALCDTNVDPTTVTYPIPANDDATKAIAFIVDRIQQAIARGSEQRKVAQAAVPQKEPQAKEEK